MAVRPGRKWSVRVVAALALACGWVGSAQVKPPAPGGLDSLPEERLYAELANRGMDLLLERAFELGGVKVEEREAVKSLAAIRELMGAGAAGLTARQRDDLIARVVSGMERNLAKSPAQGGPKDAGLLMDQAETLIRVAVFKELNTLEYWGDTVQTRGRLRPVAGVVSRMLARTAELARAQADALANKLTNAADTVSIERYQELDRLALMAEYTRRMNDYAVIASMDNVEGASRTQLAEETIEYLRQFDQPESEVQAAVRVQIGKIHAARGLAEEAVAVLDGVWENETQVRPVPTVAQRFEARYFAAAALLKAGQLDEARKRLDDMKRWVASDMSADPRARSGAEGAVMMLQYRLHVAARQEDKARETLLSLLQARPEFEGTILDQLAARVPENADIKTLDTLSLRALFRQGEMESRKPVGQSADGTLLDRGIEAGRQLLADRTAVGPMVEETAIRLPLLLERRGRSLESAVALLDFLDRFGVGHRNAGAAMDEASFLVSRLRREKPDDVAVGAVYERLLARAVAPPFSRRDLMYEWARRLQQTGKYAEAARFFEQVPETDPRAALARFFRMVAVKQMLDDGGLGGDARRTRVADVLQLAERVSSEARQRLASGQGDTRNDKLILVRTALVGADVALREQKDARSTLRQLEGFEQAAAGLSSEGQLVAQAMNLRVLALMDLGQNQEATKTLVTLLEKTGGAEGAEVVFRLLTRLNEEFDRAKAAGDANAVRTVARSRAELSGFLTSWAEKHPDARIRSYTYRYRVFDAETKRLAAGLETDATARARGLAEAAALFESLRQQPQPGLADPVVDLGLALIAYDQGRWEAARDGLAVLLEQRRLGRAVIDEERNGEMVTLPNERYWEATCKMMRATLRLIEAGKVESSAREPLADGLKALYARWGKGMGGPKWSGEFDGLRRELAPDYDPPQLDSSPAESGNR